MALCSKKKERYGMRAAFRGVARQTAQLSPAKPRRNGNWLGSWKSLAIVFMIALCSALFAAEPEGVVLVGAGSSVPLPLYRKWADLYNQTNKTVQLQYLAMGNVEGIAQITKGISDFGAGELPLSAEDRRQNNL